jgi:hypothetical protein
VANNENTDDDASVADCIAASWHVYHRKNLSGCDEVCAGGHDKMKKWLPRIVGLIALSPLLIVLLPFFALAYCIDAMFNWAGDDYYEWY